MIWDSTFLTGMITVVSNGITYVLGIRQGRKKTAVQIEKMEIENLASIVKFYKDSFKDLELQLKNVSNKCAVLTEEISVLRMENVSLKKEIHDLNNKLQLYTNK